MNILIVEDERLTLKALQHSVENLGHKAILAENGEMAIRQISENKIDFIISDVMMPGISGLSLVSVLRNILLSQVPIILISASDNSYLSISSHYVGATDFITKPFTIADIADRINKYSIPQ